jgi:hypothetical protein
MKKQSKKNLQSAGQGRVCRPLHNLPSLTVCHSKVGKRKRGEKKKSHIIEKAFLAFTAVGQVGGKATV